MNRERIVKLRDVSTITLPDGYELIPVGEKTEIGFLVSLATGQFATPRTWKPGADFMAGHIIKDGDGDFPFGYYCRPIKEPK